MHDARRHGVEVRPVDVMLSAVDCTLEDITNNQAHGPLRQRAETGAALRPG